MLQGTLKGGVQRNCCAAARLDARASAPDSKTGRAILLVDDDNHLRRACRRVLEKSGYRVMEADSANAAQQIWENNEAAVFLLVTDYEMPGLNGVQLANLLTARKPNLKTLVISGRFCDELQFPYPMPFLQKPFSPDAFIDAVQRCVG